MQVYECLCSADCRMTAMSPVSTNETVRMSVFMCLCADLLVVKNPGGSLALELLLLQDALKVLHALLWVFHVSRQVAVEEADGMAEHWHAGADTTFIPLWATASRREVRKYLRKVRNTLVKERGGFCLYFLWKQNEINEWINDVNLLCTVTQCFHCIERCVCVFVCHRERKFTREECHQYLMLTVKCTVGGQDESVGCFPLSPRLLWPTKTQKMSQYEICRICRVQTETVSL